MYKCYGLPLFRYNLWTGECSIISNVEPCFSSRGSPNIVFFYVSAFWTTTLLAADAQDLLTLPAKADNALLMLKRMIIWESLFDRSWITKLFYFYSFLVDDRVRRKESKSKSVRIPKPYLRDALNFFLFIKRATSLDASGHIWLELNVTYPSLNSDRICASN